MLYRGGGPFPARPGFEVLVLGEACPSPDRFHAAEYRRIVGLVRHIIFGRYRMKGILPDEYVVLAWEQGEAGSLRGFPAPRV